jgi:rod shape-determining protein MreD
MRAAAAFLLTEALLLLLGAEANSALSGLHVYLTLGGLVVLEGALSLPLAPSLAVALAAGGVAGATAPASVFGLQLLLFAAAAAAVHSLRERLPRESLAGKIVVALLVNLGLFLAVTALEIGHSPAKVSAVLRLFCDLLASQAVLALIAPWFFALQARSLEWAAAEPGRAY